MSWFSKPSLNEFMSQGSPIWKQVRIILQQAIQNGTLPKSSLFPLSQVQMHLPIEIGDYTDFYASKEHATNVGTMFRGKENALQPNWYQTHS